MVLISTRMQIIAAIMNNTWITTFNLLVSKKGSIEIAAVKPKRNPAKNAKV